MNRQRLTERISAALAEARAERDMSAGVLNVAKQGGYSTQYLALKVTEVSKLDPMVIHLAAALELAKGL